MNNPSLFEVGADIVRQGIRIDRRPTHQCVWQMLSGQKSDTIIPLRTTLIETELIVCRNIAKIKYFRHGLLYLATKIQNKIEITNYMSKKLFHAE